MRWRHSWRQRLLYGVALSALAVATLLLSLLLYYRQLAGKDAEPFSEDRNFVLLLIATALGSFIVGATRWKPTDNERPVVDKISLTADLVGLSFWTSAALLGLGLAVQAMFRIDWIMALYQFLVTMIWGGIMGAMLCGPIAFVATYAAVSGLRHFEKSKLPAVPSIDRGSMSAAHRWLSMLRQTMVWTMLIAALFGLSITLLAVVGTLVGT